MTRQITCMKSVQVMVTAENECVFIDINVGL